MFYKTLALLENGEPYSIFTIMEKQSPFITIIDGLLLQYKIISQKTCLTNDICSIMNIFVKSHNEPNLNLLCDLNCDFTFFRNNTNVLM